MKKIILSVLVLLPVLSSCANDQKKLDELCTELTQISKMTTDCQKMAGKLAPATDKFNAVIKKLETDVPDEASRQAYLNSLSVCLKAYLEMSTGPCKDTPEVKSHLYSEN